MNKKEIIGLFGCSEADESQLVKQETSRTVFTSLNGECSLLR